MWWSNLSIQRKISIGLVLFLSILILWFQFRQRQVIQELPNDIQEAQNMKRQWDLMALNGNVEPLPQRVSNAGHGFKEGFGIFTSQETDMANELAAVSTPLGGSGSIHNYNPKTSGNYPIKEYLIKSSYNSASTGKFMNADMIKYVLSRGCRLLDFQLYYDTTANSVMVSSFLPDNTTKTVKKDLPLGDALNTISQYGFSGPSPNLGDPLFLQFRFNTSNQYGVSNYADEMTATVAALLESRLTNRFYQSKVDMKTPIGDLMGKYVIISDRAIKDKSGTDLVNIYLGRGQFPLFTSRDVDNYLTSTLTIQNDGVTSNTTMIKIVSPLTSDKKNLAATRIMNDYGAQIVEEMYYVVDKGLTDYETMFYNFGTAFVPLYMAKEYFANIK